MAFHIQEKICPKCDALLHIYSIYILTPSPYKWKSYRNWHTTGILLKWINVLLFWVSDKIN